MKISVKQTKEQGGENDGKAFSKRLEASQNSASEEQFLYTGATREIYRSMVGEFVIPEA